MRRGVRNLDEIVRSADAARKRRARAAHQSGARFLCLLLAILAVLSSGCVSRRLTIRSNPPGAKVFVDNYEIESVTPVSVPYVYYGTRQIRLVRDGFETATVLQPIPTPWYEYFPLDFVTENLLPWEIRDERTLEFTLVPQRMVPRERLRQEAEDLRRSVQGSGAAAPGAATPATPAAPTFTPPPVVAP
ncbi:MAG: PEGA domain-containing protein [Planctomycetia bacterium]|nr:PEGA domain-containing protein [Planctomycetia bacterium]